MRLIIVPLWSLAAGCGLGVNRAQPEADALVRSAVAAAATVAADPSGAGAGVEPEPAPAASQPVAPVASPPPPTDPSVEPPPPPSPLPAIGPIDHLGERPRLIRDAPPEARVELAKKLVNPLSDLIRLPVVMNYEEGFGPTGVHRFNWNFQPFVPVRLNEDWNLISRTNIPLVNQPSLIPGDSDDDTGLGDVVQSILIAPQDARQLWAVGPAFIFPTGQEEFIGNKKWSVGPNAVALVQEGPWIAGAIGSHFWSFAGDDDRRNVNLTTVSPFVAYTTSPTAFTFQLDVDVLYNWDAGNEQDAWTIPINFSIAHIRRLGRNLVSVGVGGRYYAESPENGPEWGVRIFLTYLFRK